jgi:hypothetical protein
MVTVLSQALLYHWSPMVLDISANEFQQMMVNRR